MTKTPPFRTANLPKAPQQPAHRPEPPTLLHKLISLKDWPAAISACQSNPHHAGIGSGPEFRDERGYTALHSLLAYNRDARGEDLVPVVNAILKGAEEVDFGGDYHLRLGGVTNSIATASSSYDFDDGDGKVALGDEDVNTNTVITNQEKSEGTEDPQESPASRATGGSWRMLQDQKNRARWSPLHLMCVQGGIIFGGLPLLKCLLQIQPNFEQSPEREKVNVERRKHLLSLLDRQNRNVLHHLLEIVVPSRKSFELAPYILQLNPTLAFQRDSHDKIPLLYVFDRIMESPGTRRRHFMESYGNDDEGLRKNYNMLKLLIRLMSLSEHNRTIPRDKGNLTHVDNARDVEYSYSENVERYPADTSSMNVLHAACRLPPSCSNGKIIQFLLSPEVTSMENDRNLAEERDDNGNYALHIFLSNASNLRDVNNDDNSLFTAAVQLYKKYPEAISTPNNADRLPFDIATKYMKKLSKVGISILSFLVIQYPQAVLLDPSLENVKLLTPIFGAIAIQDGRDGIECDGHTSSSRLTAMYILLRSRPVFVSFGGNSKQFSPSTTTGIRNDINSTKYYNGGNAKEKKWWGKLVPFM